MSDDDAREQHGWFAPSSPEWLGVYDRIGGPTDHASGGM